MTHERFEEEFTHEVMDNDAGRIAHFREIQAKLAAIDPATIHAYILVMLTDSERDAPEDKEEVNSEVLVCGTGIEKQAMVDVLIHTLKKPYQ